jgi:hypothetical protein
MRMESQELKGEGQELFIPRSSVGGVVRHRACFWPTRVPQPSCWYPCPDGVKCLQCDVTCFLSWSGSLVVTGPTLIWIQREERIGKAGSMHKVRAKR